MKTLSIVIPVFNEAKNVEKVHQEIVDVCETEGYDYEIIFIDDGSTDATIDILKRLSPVKMAGWHPRQMLTLSLSE